MELRGPMFNSKQEAIEAAKKVAQQERGEFSSSTVFVMKAEKVVRRSPPPVVVEDIE